MNTNMKKIFKIRFILLFFALGIQFSCSKYLELLPPSGLVREEFWQTKSDVEAVLMGGYRTFASMNGDLFTYGEVRGDMVRRGISLGGNEVSLMESNINPENGLCNWANFYKVINYCNDVIKNAPEVQKIDNTFTDFQLQGYLSEAHFLRALSYFYLVRIFKDVPLVLLPSESDATDFYIPKTDGDQILTEMLKYLNDNRKYANDKYTTAEVSTTLANLKGRATKASYDALIADICLWRFDYNGCIEACDRVMANSNYKLLSSSVWFELFYPGNSAEGIFELQFSDKNKQPNSLYGKTYYGFSQYIPSQRAVELFAVKYADEPVRGQKSSIEMIGEDFYGIWKYVGAAPDEITLRKSEETNSCNWIVYRLADIYLMKAEALSQLSRFGEAAAVLNQIRSRANVSPLAISNSVVDYEDAIMDERALELAFEGKRWFDLMRMGRRNNFSRKAKLIDLIVANANSAQKRILSAKLSNTYGWYLPIAKSEIERNKNLVQNPYYIY
jgi:hypothetical protein